MNALPPSVQALSGQLSALLLCGGLLLWFWGTWPLLEGGSYLGRLHKLSISDTLGSVLMLLGLLLRIPGHWPLLSLALLGLIVWNTIFGYVLASCSQPWPSDDPRDPPPPPP
ncbi:MAG: monovalent cation/H(+) antiporter subunit G [Cyanobacteriota bacterium]|nr:monovalent cation/H(+) antiporter subunit G [Cyanobacteriota bacterium]